MTKTKIVIRTPEGAILTFFTNYELEFKEGMIFFTDVKSNTYQGYPTSWCQVSEVD